MLVATGDEPAPVVEQSEEERAAELAERTLTESIFKRPAGLSVSYPQGWKRSERRGIVVLESPDRCVVISLSAPAKAADVKRLRKDSIFAVRQSFKRIRVGPDTGADLGGEPTSGAVIAVRNRQGGRVVIRLSVSRGRELAHLTEVVVRDPGCAETLAQMRLILDSLEFSR